MQERTELTTVALKYFEKIFTSLLPRSDCDDSEAEKDTGPAEYEEIPEPEEEVEFSVEIIERENTETVVCLYRSRHSVGVDGTFSDFGENLSDLFLQIISRCTAHDVEAIVEKTSTEEKIHEIHLAEDVDQVQELTEDEFGDVEVVSSVIFVEIINNHSSLLLRLLLHRV